MMRRVAINVIAHEQQRYDTCGDWQFDVEGNLQIYVSETGDWRSNMMVALHELIEVVLCTNDGVTQEAVDAFDMTHLDSDEPGDDPIAPYRDQHCFSTAVERMMCAALKMAWAEHDKRVSTLTKEA